jgi:hypothetical protein
VALGYVSEERIESIIRVKRISEIGTTNNVVFLRSVLRLLVTANVFLSSPILVTLRMKALHFSEKSVVTRVTRRNIPKTEFFIVTSVSNLTNYFSFENIVMTAYYINLGTI